MESTFLHKYQPQTLSNFETHQEILDILYQLLKIDSLNILFIGDVGCGKTAFLKSLISEYYSGYSPYQYNNNILHINNLDEQGIHYYRNDVKTFCQTTTSIKGRKKIVVLDDIDSINEQSQQVFRNFIDKYSHNVNFIASCVYSQKVIDTLQSRFMIIKIKPLTHEHLYKIMDNIIQQENIIIDEPAKSFILNISDNSAKVLINYLEKIKLLNEPVNLELANTLCTNIGFYLFEEYISYVINNKLQEAIKLLYDIYYKGHSVIDILDNFFIFVKNTHTLNETQKYEIIPVICKYISIFHNIHEDEIELACFSNNLCSIIGNK
jgi:DNA polymerase III delta prime subunit